MSEANETIEGALLSSAEMDIGAGRVCTTVTSRALFPCEFDRLEFAKLLTLITVAQYTVDLCINEIERRGELKMCPDCNGPIIPYMSDHGVETIFTREQPPESAKH